MERLLQDLDTGAISATDLNQLELLLGIARRGDKMDRIRRVRHELQLLDEINTMTFYSDEQRDFYKRIFKATATADVVLKFRKGNNLITVPVKVIENVPLSDRLKFKDVYLFTYDQKLEPYVTAFGMRERDLDTFRLEMFKTFNLSRASKSNHIILSEPHDFLSLAHLLYRLRWWPQ
jgi:hypothetical protein